MDRPTLMPPRYHSPGDPIAPGCCRTHWGVDHGPAERAADGPEPIYVKTERLN